MKFGMSNLAWPAEAEQDAFGLLTRAGFEGIEVAPTRIADWDSLTEAKTAEYRRRCHASGLRVSSLQAILFNRPDAQLLGDAGQFAVMSEHTRRIGGIAAALDAGVAVFGAPRNRSRLGLAQDAAMALAADRFAALGDIVAEAGLVIGIEPVPDYYGADFLTRAEEVAHLVERCDHRHVRAHLDCACIQLAGDDAAEAVRRYSKLMVHYHAAEPDLGPFATPKCDHAGVADALSRSDYDGWVVIEMKQQDTDALSAVRTATDFVNKTYRPSFAA